MTNMQSFFTPTLRRHYGMISSPAWWLTISSDFGDLSEEDAIKLLIDRGYNINCTSDPITLDNHPLFNSIAKANSWLANNPEATIYSRTNGEWSEGGLKIRRCGQLITNSGRWQYCGQTTDTSKEHPQCKECNPETGYDLKTIK